MLNLFCDRLSWMFYFRGIFLLYAILYSFFFSHHWRAVLLGQAVFEEREWWSIQTAKTLCQRLLADTHKALEQVCMHASMSALTVSRVSKTRSSVLDLQHPAV